MDAIEVGDRVKIPFRNTTGEVAFIGETHFSKGKWFGIILDDAKGNYDGVVDGIRYFKCPKKCGIFVKAHLVEKELVKTCSGKDKQHKVLSNSIKHPNFLRANLKVKAESFSNTSENRDSFIIFKHSVLREIEKIKKKFKITDYSVKEILDKLDKLKKEISLLKKEAGCWKKQSYSGFCLKPMEMNHSKLLEINNNFINIYDDELIFSVNEFSLNDITSIISKQHVELEEQQNKTLQGLIEIKNIFNSKLQVTNMDFHSSVSQYSPYVKGNNLCTSSVAVDSPDNLKIKVSTSKSMKMLK